MREARGRLAAEYGMREAAAMIDEMMLRIKGWDKTATIIHGNETVTDFLKGRVEATVGRLLDGEPIQYIFGKAHFYGMDFNVTRLRLYRGPRRRSLSI